MKTYKYPSVLTIAGFDSSGGAGIQADIKTISALGCYATSVLTALPVQNTTGVKSIFSIPSTVVEEQIKVVLDDIIPGAIKIGMVHSIELVYAITNTLKQYQKIPIIFDPVMVATSGHHLIETETIDIIKKELFPISELITPNMDEASVLSKIEVETIEDIKEAGHIILQQGCKNVLLKGGHLKTENLTSILFSQNKPQKRYESKKVESKNVHGSGCTLSSAIASYIARGYELSEAIKFAQDYVYESILSGKDVTTGQGNGPLNHFHNPTKSIINEVV